MTAESNRSPYSFTGTDSSDNTNDKESAWWQFEAACFLAVIVLAILASLHAWQKQDLNAYRTSALILPEMLSLLVCFVAIPVLVLRTIYFLCRRLWRHAGIVFAVAIVVFLGTSFAIWLDASTLIYMT